MNKPQKQDEQLPPANLGPSGSAKWVLVIGAVIGIIGVLFFMGLVIASLFGMQVPPDSRFLVVIILALTVGLASSFLGGGAAAQGNLSLPGVGHPLGIALVGGVATVIITLTLGYWFYAKPAPATQPPPAPKFTVVPTLDFYGVKNSTLKEEFREGKSPELHLRARTLTSGPQKDRTSVTVEIPEGAQDIRSKSEWDYKRKPSGRGLDGIVVAGNVVTASGWIRGEDKLYGPGVHAKISLRVDYKIPIVSQNEVIGVALAGAVLVVEPIYFTVPEGHGPLKKVSIVITRYGNSEVYDRVEANIPKELSSSLKHTSEKGHFEAEIFPTQVVVRVVEPVKDQSSKSPVE